MFPDGMHKCLQQIISPHFRQKWLIALLALSILVHRNLVSILSLMKVVKWFSLDKRKGVSSRVIFVFLVGFF
jgi:hypothetical protein